MGAGDRREGRCTDLAGGPVLFHCAAHGDIVHTDARSPCRRQQRRHCGGATPVVVGRVVVEVRGSSGRAAQEW